MAPKTGTVRQEVVVFTCPVCGADVTGDVTFRIANKGTSKDANNVVRLQLEPEAVGLSIRHKCDLDTQDGLPDPEPSSVSSLPDL